MTPLTVLIGNKVRVTVEIYGPVWSFSGGGTLVLGEMVVDAHSPFDAELLARRVHKAIKDEFVGHELGAEGGTEPVAVGAEGSTEPVAVVVLHPSYAEDGFTKLVRRP